MRLSRVAALAAPLLLVASPALAQLKENQPLKTSRYTLDLYQGPVFSGARIMGLAGGYTPIAEGVAGYEYNPASVANRVPWSVDNFDWDLDGGITLPSSVTNVDFDNNGDDAFANSAAIFLTGGGGLQFGAFGVGLVIDFSQYQVTGRAGADKGKQLNLDFITSELVAGYALARGQLVLGLGLGAHNVAIERPIGGANTQNIANVTGVDIYAGAVFAPIGWPVRAGASVRVSPPDAKSAPTDDKNQPLKPDSKGNYLRDGYYLPRAITLPTEVQAGLVIQLWRPLNFGFVTPKKDPTSAQARVEADIEEEKKLRTAARASAIDEARKTGGDVGALEKSFDQNDERADALAERRIKEAKRADHVRRLRPYKDMPREKLALVVAAKLTAITTDGVGLESFLTQKVQRSGEEVTVQPSGALEGEAFKWLALRGGSYLEPTRFTTRGGPRVHGTAGFDVRLPFTWSVFGLFDDDTSFRVGGAADVALRYFGWSVTAGIWR